MKKKLKKQFKNLKKGFLKVKDKISAIFLP